MSSLSDLDLAAAAKEAGIERAELGANPYWAVTALWAVRSVASRKPSLTTDDVWAVLEDLQVKTPEHRAMGAVMRQAAVSGYIEPTDSYVRSRRPQCHCRPVLYWRSLLFDASAA